VVELARVSRKSSRRLWNCRPCRKQFGVKVGTVMEDSPIGLDKWLPAFWLPAFWLPAFWLPAFWLPAFWLLTFWLLTFWLLTFWLLTSAKNGISSCELARVLGITQKSAVVAQMRLIGRTRFD